MVESPTRPWSSISCFEATPSIQVLQTSRLRAPGITESRLRAPGITDRGSADGLQGTFATASGAQRQRTAHVELRTWCTFFAPKHMEGPISIWGQQICSWSRLLVSVQ